MTQRVRSERKEALWKNNPLRALRILGDLCV